MSPVLFAEVSQTRARVGRITVDSQHCLRCGELLLQGLHLLGRCILSTPTNGTSRHSFDLTVMHAQSERERLKRFFK